MLSRRRFLKQTAGFSAALALAGVRPAIATEAAPPSTTPSGAPSTAPDACHLLAVGDFGVKPKDLARQQAVADAMKAYVRRLDLRPDALALLGDNFYGGLGRQGVRSPRWDEQIERMYPRDVFPGPLLAMLGNHDYGDGPNRKSAEAQLAYRRHRPDSRWTMPARWYAADLPGLAALATCHVLDTNFVYGTKWLTKADRDRQLAWLDAELAQPRPAPWRIVLGHHPVYSDGLHGDEPDLVEHLDPLLRRHAVDLYLCGHDHDLQHLAFADHPTAFAISGGGGARARDLKKDRAVFGQSVYGFTHLTLTPDRLTLRHLDANGAQLHAFTKPRHDAATISRDRV